MSLFLAAVLAGLSAWLIVRPSLRPTSWLTGSGTAIGAVRSRLLTRGRRARQRAAMREALAEVVADIRAGQPPVRAVERALAPRDGVTAPRTWAAARWGGDIASCLRQDAQETSQAILAAAGACWTVASAQGAGLADALDRLVGQDRRAEEVRRQLDAQLAAPRATARMLALLPVLGLALGFAVGGDPIAWLTGTSLGWACLALGVLCIALGLAWAGRIVSRTERLL